MNIQTAIFDVHCIYTYIADQEYQEENGNIVGLYDEYYEGGRQRKQKKHGYKNQHSSCTILSFSCELIL